LDGAIQEHRSKLRLFVYLSSAILAGAAVLAVVSVSIDADIVPYLDKIGGTPIASMFIGSIGSVPTIRECFAQWSGVRALQDMKRGYTQNPSLQVIEKLDELFWHTFKGRIGI
jgi:hypothetical protein